MSSTFISNSKFTQKNLKQWGVPSKVLYPYLDSDFMNDTFSKVTKKKIILSVGRFFKHLHSKRQDVIITYFKKLKKEITDLNDYTLILAGGLNKDDTAYFEELKSLIKNDPSIELKPNLPYATLKNLYEKAEVYWHFAGYEVDEDKHPELTEHLGIAPLEAMASGCVVFCYRAGGLKELIDDGHTGYLFNSYNEMKEKMSKYFQSDKNTQITENAKKYVIRNFSYDVFKDEVISLFT